MKRPPLALILLALVLGGVYFILDFPTRDDFAAESRELRDQELATKISVNLPGLTAAESSARRRALNSGSPEISTPSALMNPCIQYLEAQDYPGFMDCQLQGGSDIERMLDLLKMDLLNTGADPYAALQTVRDRYGYLMALEICDSLARMVPINSPLLHKYRAYLWGEPPTDPSELATLVARIRSGIHEPRYGLPVEDFIPSLGLMPDTYREHAQAELESLLINDLDPSQIKARSAAIQAAYNQIGDPAIAGEWLMDRLDTPSGWDLGLVAMDTIELTETGSWDLISDTLIPWASLYPDQWVWVEDNAEILWPDSPETIQFIRDI